MGDYGLPYRSTMCSLKIYASKVVAISKKNVFSLGYVSFRKKKQFMSLLILNICKHFLLLAIDASTLACVCQYPDKWNPWIQNPWHVVIVFHLQICYFSLRVIFLYKHYITINIPLTQCIDWGEVKHRCILVQWILSLVSLAILNYAML